MSEQDTTPSIQKLMTQMSQMRAELNTLKTAAQHLPQAVGQTKLTTSTTRRKALLGLAGGLVGAVGMVGIAATPPTAGAKVAAKVGRVGAVIAPAGDAALNDLPSGTSKYGLIALSGRGNFDLSLATNVVERNCAMFASSNDTGVYGNGDTIGVYGKSNNIGVFGDGSSYGVYGKSNNIGVYGNGVDYGVYGVGDIGGSFSGSVGAGGLGGGGSIVGTVATNTRIGMVATADVVVGLGNLFAANQAVGLYATAGSGSGRNPTAAYFQGTVAVVGTLSKSAGSFKIDHPLDPANKFLYHSFVESPDMLNIYSGIATLDKQGEALVKMPDWFEALNRDCRYQLTCLGQYAPVFIAEEIKNGKFTIAGGTADQRISWQVTGIRQDAYAKAHPIPVEELKGEGEKGKYLHPEVFPKAK